MLTLSVALHYTMLIGLRFSISQQRENNCHGLVN